MINEGILNQLGYSINDATLRQLDRIISNTPGFEHLEKHIIVLNDHLKPYLSYVAMSNSHNYLKIKNEAQSEQMREDVTDIVQKWAEKYKVELQKVEGKETYYIKKFLGHL